MSKHSITLDPDTIKCLSNIPASYFMKIGSPARFSYRLAGTSHGFHCSMVGVSVKLKLLDKIGPSNLWMEGGAGKNWCNNEKYK